LSFPENFKLVALPFSLDGTAELQLHENQRFDFENFRFDVFSSLNEDIALETMDNAV
jgi:hypothetical protein